MFFTLLQNAVDDSRFEGNLEQASNATDGIGPKYLSNLMRSRNSPKFEVILSLCKTLGRTPNYFAGYPEGGPTIDFDRDFVTRDSAEILQALTGYERHAAGRVYIEDIIDLRRQHSGDLRAMSKSCDAFDIYHIPRRGDSTIRIASMGANSLATTILNPNKDPNLQSSVTEIVQAAIDNFDQDLSKKLLNEHRQAAAGNLVLSEESLSVPHPKKPGSQVSVKYKRFLALVKDTDGSDKILNYSNI